MIYAVEIFLTRKSFSQGGGAKRRRRILFISQSQSVYPVRANLQSVGFKQLFLTYALPKLF
ncbi:MAG: hypothetical protein ABIP51_00075 [Bacteroidia bacterium]